MGSSFFWQQYVADQAEPNLTSGNFNMYEQAFVEQKQNIADLILGLSPASVAILGAGYLNDIPLAELLSEDRTIYLVDWQDQAPKNGVTRRVLQQDDENQYRCLCCNKHSGKDYCDNFSGKYLDDGVCTSFRPVNDPYLTCESYQPAKEPHFIRADITSGVARSFAAHMEEHLMFCSSPHGAFLRAMNCVDQYQYRALPINGNSMELVTSSMVLSQFDFEPYTYFSRLMEEQFGYQTLQQQEQQLRPLMEELRSRLFARQVEAHIKEIHRIVKKDDRPRVYLSTELFRSYPDSDHYFVVQDMSMALDIIGKYFLFSFSGQSDGKILSRSELGDGSSINQCYRLVARTDI